MTVGDVVPEGSETHAKVLQRELPAPAGGLRHAAALRRPGWLTPDLVRGVRWLAVGVWIAMFAEYIYERGIPYFRSDLLMWLAIGLFAASIGKRNVLLVLLDFFPLALVLIYYDQLRGISDSLGMPTWWYPQIDVDKALFFGHEPTVWLQSHILYPKVQWWEAFVALCYVSFFFLPYVTAAVLWLRSRADFYRWSLQFVALSFIGFTFFALTPAAPPWAAAKCTARQVASHPYDPYCMSNDPQSVPGGGLLGTMHQTHAGASPVVDRLVGRGFADLHMSFASALIKAGQGGVDEVAAVPSLHAGGVMLFTIFMWRRLNKWWRPFLIFYPLFMVFTLTFTAEHYVSDCLAGWLAAAVVSLVARRIERWRKSRRRADTLERPAGIPLETPSCPPTRSLPATTPSST